MRIASIAMISLLAFAGGLHAQIAAPKLAPTPGVEVNNPAVLPWGGPSYVSAAYIDAVFDITPLGGTPVRVGDFEAFAVQVRLVGETFAFQADTTSAEIVITPTLGGGSLETDDSSVSGAFQVGGVFSIGIAVEKDDLALQGFSADETLPVLGATLRLGEMFYLGAAGGIETLKDSTTISETERSVLRTGAGVHSRDQDGGYHLEAYMETRDSATSLNGPNADEEATIGVTAEVVFAGGFLISLARETVDTTTPAGAAKEESDDTTISLGWAPPEGLSVVLTLIVSEETDVETAGGNFGELSEIQQGRLRVAWSF